MLERTHENTGLQGLAICLYFLNANRHEMFLFFHCVGEGASREVGQGVSTPSAPGSENSPGGTGLLSRHHIKCWRLVAFSIPNP